MSVNAAGLLEAEPATEIVARWESTDRRFAASLHSGVSQAQALAKLGVRLCVQERLNEAIAVFRAAISLSPREPLLWSNLGVVLERSGQPAEAIDALAHSLELAPRQFEAWLLLANLKTKGRDLAGAEAAYQEALAIDPTSPFAWQGLGLLKQQQRDYHRAIECLITCAKSGSATAPVISILGQLFYQTGQFEKSRDAYVAASELDPQSPGYDQMRRKMRFLCEVMAGDSVDEALANFRQSPLFRPMEVPLDELLKTSFSLLSGYGHTNAAKRVGQMWLASNPGSATIAYLLKALDGDPALARSPEAYLIEYFDAFAEEFDQKLVQVLGYDVPRKLCELVTEQSPADQKRDILDIGCGTGLCGPLLRSMAASLTGVDLSARMLQLAARRKVYDRLVQQEVTVFLAGATASADLVIAADVLIYFGDLEPLFAAVAHSLRPGGLFAFSIERSGGAVRALLPSGRFAHAPEYVAMIAAPHFTPIATRPTTVRLEATAPVSGELFVLRRNEPTSSE